MLVLLPLPPLGDALGDDLGDPEGRPELLLVRVPDLFRRFVSLWLLLTLLRWLPLDGGERCDPFGREGGGAPLRLLLLL